MRFSSKVVSSSLFFFMAVFLFLSLLTSSVSETFEQLFALFSYPHRAYDITSTFMLFVLAGLCVWFVAFSTKHALDNKFEQVLALGIGIISVSVVLIRILRTQQGINVLQQTPSFATTILTSGSLVVLFVIIYLFFIFIPLILDMLKLKIIFLNKFEKELVILKPSVNTALLMTFACCIQPFYDKSNLWLYLDLLASIGAIFVVSLAVYKSKEKFGFYENANIIWLIIGILIFMLTSKIIAQADYNIVRVLFIIIGLITWCSDWMALSIERSLEHQLKNPQPKTRRKKLFFFKKQAKKAFKKIIKQEARNNK